MRSQPPLDVLAVLRLLLGNWHIVVPGTLLFAMLGLAFTFLLERQYRAEVLLLSVTDAADGLTLVPEQLTALSRVLDPGNLSRSPSAEALATLRSRAFAESFIVGNGLTPVLDRGPILPLPSTKATSPSINKAVSAFHREVLKVSQDRRSGTILLTVTWSDRHQAAAWANALVESANQTLRMRALDEAEANLRYLTRELERTAVVGVRDTIFRLTESQVRSKMLANTRVEYAFKVIDPARTSDEDQYISPRRSIYAFAGASLGIGLALLVISRRRAANAGA
jgi:uncharacterized protein involved in exopolysaccharide biosynthesis